MVFGVGAGLFVSLSVFVVSFVGGLWLAVVGCLNVFGRRVVLLVPVATSCCVAGP